jgi:hypothetical protein
MVLLITETFMTTPQSLDDELKKLFYVWVDTV